MEKLELHQVTDGPLELIPYRPDIFAKNEVEYRYKLALYLHKIGVCESVLLSSGMFQSYYPLLYSDDLPILMKLYTKLDMCNNEEFYDYLDCYPLSPTCDLLTKVRADDYITDRFKKGKFSIDNLIEMAEVYNKFEYNILHHVTDHILTSNEGDATNLIRLLDLFILPDEVICSLLRYGNSDAHKYLVESSRVSIEDLLIISYNVSEETCDLIVNLLVKKGYSIEDLLLLLGEEDDSCDVICHIVEKFDLKKIKLHEVTDGSLELIPYRPPIVAKDELEYRCELALYLHKIGICDSFLLDQGQFTYHYLEIESYNELPRLMLAYTHSFEYDWIGNGGDEYYDYLDCYPLSPTCRHIAHKSVSLHKYLSNRFKRGKFTIDNLIEMVKIYDMGDKVDDVLYRIVSHVLCSNGGDATEVIRLIDSIENVDLHDLVLPFVCHGNYDAFKYITSFPEVSISDMLGSIQNVNRERLSIVIGYYLKDGASAEKLLIDLDPEIIIENDGDEEDIVEYIIEHYQPDLEVVLRDIPKDHFVVDIIEEIIENNV